MQVFFKAKALQMEKEITQMPAMKEKIKTSSILSEPVTTQPLGHGEIVHLHFMHLKMRVNFSRIKTNLYFESDSYLNGI